VFGEGAACKGRPFFFALVVGVERKAGEGIPRTPSFFLRFKRRALLSKAQDFAEPVGIIRAARAGGDLGVTRDVCQTRPDELEKKDRGVWG
jgi:hypothetical protein